ncbi:MAG: Stp1/IreP family PP2C-type Ser/Thr phosphatase [Actinomycetota bacterium]|nr:Stp1/IreP family PP2C-type Ser/Thr phosphatase [Actinomycetota bacterium]
MNVAVGAKTDVGQIREANEDSYLVEGPLFVVADGMGGHIAGDVASSTAVEVIANRSSEASAENPQTLAGIVRGANNAIFEKAASDPAFHGMGTTCTLVLLDENRAHIAHVGDSRAYLLREDSLRQVTEDHTLVARMVKEGRLRAEDAERHPQRSIITRALGVDADVEVDLTTLDLKDGDRIMLCSDGLSSMIDNDTIAGVLRSEEDPQSAADSLVDLANRAGGEDNVTVVVIDVTEKPVRRKPKPSLPGRADAVTAPRRSPRRAALLLIALAILSGGAYALVSYVLDNSWYVGVTEGDQLAVFQGIPEDVLGLSFKDVVEESGVSLRDLPENLRDSVQEGRKADSREEAEGILTDLEQRAKEFEDRLRPDPEPSPKPTPDAKDGDNKRATQDNKRKDGSN